MPLATNATMTFTDYETGDEGITLHFVSPNPGPGQVSDYFILLTDADLATITTQLQLKNLVETKLKRKLRANGIAAKLDPFIGQSLII